MPEFVGRAEPLTRLVAAHRAVAEVPARGGVGAAALVLVTGEAGIGKSALLRRFADTVASAGATVTWGTCWDDRRAPAWWPWTEALRGLTAARPGTEVPTDVAPLLSVRTDDPVGAAANPAGRLRLLDGVATLLATAATDHPVVVVLDDLHWGDPSTLDLLRFLARRPGTGRVLLVGSYRPDEAPADVAAVLAELAMAAELVPLSSLGESEVTALVAAVAGPDAAARWGATVHQRSAGHPFFARELCRALAAGEDPRSMPAVVLAVIRRQLDALSADCTRLLEVAAVAGSAQSTDVLGAVAGLTPAATAAAVGDARDAGVLARDVADVRFAHDLYREGVLANLPAEARAETHRRLVESLAARRARGASGYPGDLARHAVAALPAVPVADAIAWSREAAAVEEGRYAFAEAARYLGDVRAALRDPPVDLAVAEADLDLKAGDARRAHALLDAAWARAVDLGDGELMGAVALGLDRCGARFAMPRERLVGVLEAARAALGPGDRPVSARVTAALARQLQHSVPADRPRARPLADEAVAIARRLDDVPTLASCLLAQHDSLWTPGTAARRVEIAGEITALTRAGGDREALAQGLLLTASAQLETGSPAFRATFREYAAVTRDLRQRRHDYLLLTRESALALLDGDIDRGDRLSTEAAELGEEVGDTDAGNVRMSQLLEVTRARGHPPELRETATRAVEWWVGAPAHAHAIAAGFLARAGDLDGARRELDTVLSLEDWRVDRSYLWSVFVGELVTAAIALDDRDLCRLLRDDLRPLRTTCAVNGALVCFMGAHAHHLGLLHAALGDRREADLLLREALATHQRLGAHLWAAETEAALARLGSSGVTLRPAGDVWEVSYAGRSATVRDSKGLRDLGRLVASPGVDVPALELAGSTAPTGGSDAVLDRAALAAYRRRLGELDAELADAAGDLGRMERASTEREALLAELRRSTRPDGSSRGMAGSDAERARKAVSARIRDAIARIEQVHPELGRHLDRSVVTGTACRYEPDDD